MKKSSLIILAIVLVLAFFFYFNMYKNGTFNEVKIEEKSKAKHFIQGKWLEGSFSVSSEEEAFFEFQRLLIEDLKCEKVSVFYAVNPTKENHNTFKAFMGAPYDSSQTLLSKEFIVYDINLGQVLAGSQICSPGYHRIHRALQDRAEEESKKLSHDSIYEEFTKKNFYVEMKVDNR